MRRLKNRNDLRQVDTIRDVEQLNAAISENMTVIIRIRERNPALEMRSLFLRHRLHSIYEKVPSRVVFQQYGRGKKEYTEADWELVSEIVTYARPSRHDAGWGAYILPANAQIGERFFIPDLIEDLLATEFWYAKKAAEEAEAIWNGEDLIIDHNSYKYELVG